MFSWLVFGASQPVLHVLVHLVMMRQPSAISECFDHLGAEFGLGRLRLLVCRQVFVPSKQISHPLSSVGHHFAVVLTQDSINAIVLVQGAQENVSAGDSLAAIASAGHLLDVGGVEFQVAVHENDHLCILLQLEIDAATKASRHEEDARLTFGCFNHHTSKRVVVRQLSDFQLQRLGDRNHLDALVSVKLLQEHEDWSVLRISNAVLHLHIELLVILRHSLVEGNRQVLVRLKFLGRRVLLPLTFLHSQHLPDDVFLELRKRCAAHQEAFANKIAKPSQCVVWIFEVDAEVAHDLVRLIDDVQVGCPEIRKVGLAEHVNISLDLVLADDLLELFGKQIRGGQDVESLVGSRGSIIAVEHHGHQQINKSLSLPGTQRHHTSLRSAVYVLAQVSCDKHLVATRHQVTFQLGLTLEVGKEGLGALVPRL